MSHFNVRRKGREIQVETEEGLRGGDVLTLGLGSDSYSLVLERIDFNGNPGDPIYIFHSRTLHGGEGIDRWKIPSHSLITCSDGRIDGEQVGSSVVQCISPSSREYDHLNTVLSARGIK